MSDARLWTAEEDAKLVEIVQTMPGRPAFQIARAAAPILGRPVNGISFRIKRRPDIYGAFFQEKPEPAPEASEPPPPRRDRMTVQIVSGRGTSAQSHSVISLPAAPFDLAPHPAAEVRPL